MVSPPRPRRAAALLALTLLACAPGAPAPRTSVLLVTFDTTRVDAVGCYGGPEGVTPTIDALAADGLRFERAYTPAPLTLPAHASLLTGLDPDRHGVRSNESYALPATERTLAEILAEEGYRTGAFVASRVLDADFGLAQGFERYDDELDARAAADVTRVAERPADQVTDALLAWLEEDDGARPFFAWLHYYDPHYPHELRPGQRARFDSVYHDEVHFADAQLGRVLDLLEREERLADTLVVVTADHGEGQGEHDEDTHGYFLYEGTQRVPLVLSHPRLPRRGVDRVPASLVDVVPTVLAFLDLGGVLEGVDLLDPARDSRDPIYMEAELGRIDFGLVPLRGALAEELKLIEGPAPELYDLLADPRELRDLAALEPARADALRRWLRARPEAEADGARHRPDSEASARLRALGYAGGAADAAPEREDWTPEQLARWSRELTTGLRRYQEGDLEGAVRFLEPLVREVPGCFSGRRYLGMALARGGRAAEGLAHLEAAAASQPDASADLWWNVATGRALGGDPCGAEAALVEVARLEPGHARARQKLAELALGRGEPAAARPHLEALLELAPGSAEARWARGRLGPR